MGKGRLEAFSDGVIAIIITIMVLELRPPHDPDFAALKPLGSVAASYALSFVTLGIYWNNHHHLFQVARRVNGAILWANMHLLFWLSLIPFVTVWMGENDFAKAPVVLYGAALLFAGVAYFILAQALVRDQPDSELAQAIGRDLKGWISLIGYAVAIPVAFVAPWVAFGIYIAVNVAWLIPDRRIERVIGGREEHGDHHIHEVVVVPPHAHSDDLSEVP